MKIKDGFVLRKIADTWVVVPVGNRVIDFNGLVSLNETGAFIWKQLENDISKEEIVNRLQEQFNVDQKIAEKDLDEFIQELNAKDAIIH